MEDKKLFNVRDNFFIAEALDALGLGLPVPVHTQKEFDEQPDAFIIWQKLFALTAVIPPGSTPLLTFKISLTPVQVQNLFSIPVLAVPAPGVGKVIEMISSTLKLTFNSVAYTNVFALFVQKPFPPDFTFYNQGLNSAVDYLTPGVVNPGFNNLLENTALSLQADADSLVGDSNVIITGAYRIANIS